MQGWQNQGLYRTRRLHNRSGDEETKKRQEGFPVTASTAKVFFRAPGDVVETGRMQNSAGKEFKKRRERYRGRMGKNTGTRLIWKGLGPPV